MKFYTIQNPPPNYAEKFEKPTLTRASDYVSITEIFAKYGMDPSFVPPQYRPINQLTAEERDVLENAADIGELEDEDILIQKEFIDGVHDKLVGLSKKKVEVSEPTQPKAEPEPSPKVTEVE